MKPAELATALADLRQTDEELAATLVVPPQAIREWREGSAPIPRRYARLIAWLAEGSRRADAVEAAGLPECEWIRQQEAREVPEDPKEALNQYREISRHGDSCEVCTARQKYISERFGPMPPMPSSGWLRVFEWVERLPGWARPAVVGAAFLAGVVALRMLPALPSLIASPRRIGDAALALLAAAAAGASGGLAYSITRPVFKTLGRPGDYLTGIACVFAYMLSLALLAPVAFGEPLVTDRVHAWSLVIVSVVFGLLVGHVWFRDK